MQLQSYQSLFWEHLPVNPKSPYPRSSTKKTTKFGERSFDEDCDAAVTVKILFCAKQNRRRYRLPAVRTTLRTFRKPGEELIFLQGNLLLG